MNPVRPKKKAKCLCATPFCRNRRKSDRLVCSKCNQRKWREAHPIQASFDSLRTHARGRGIGFELTIEEFTKFCEETDYHVTKGCKPDSATVDRRDPDGPYAYYNIRVLSHMENSTRRDDPFVYTEPTNGDPY